LTKLDVLLLLLLLLLLQEINEVQLQGMCLLSYIGMRAPRAAGD
jgi:hypothetical protein